MNNELDRVGSIPLDGSALEHMGVDEQVFWTSFLGRIASAIREAEEDAELIPYKLPPDLAADLRRAIEGYDGDKYRQISEIRILFDCRAALGKPATVH